MNIRRMSGDVIYRTLIKAIVVFLILLMTADGLAQQHDLDPIEKRKLRNAQLEKASPTMDRVQSMELKPVEIMARNIGEVSRSLKQVEEVLDTLSLIGDRHDQAAALLNIDQNSRAILATLLSKEGVRVEQIRAARKLKERQSQVTSINRERANRSIQTLPKPINTVQRTTAPKNHKIQPVLAKVFDRSDRPAKAILRVGTEFSKTVYVGQSFVANEIEYKLSSVKIVGENKRVPGRKTYEIVIEDQAGLRKTLVWD